MLYKNSIKILFSNFNIVWKSIIYYLLSFVACIGLIFLCLNPVYKILDNSGFWTMIVDSYTNFLSSLDLNQLMEMVNYLIDKFWEVMVANISQFWFSFISVAVVGLFFATIIANLTIMPSCNTLHYYMGSMNKHGFWSSFNETFWKSLKVQLVHFLISIPINAVNVVLLILGIKLFSSYWLLSIFAGFLIVLEIVLLVAFKYSLLVNWIPTMVIMNYGVFKSLKVSIKNTFRNFARIFSSSIGVVLTIIIINVVFGLFTFMAGLLISVPASYLLYSTFGMVSTYENQGMRYYVDVCNVVTPKKRERTDKLADMKYIV